MAGSTFEGGNQVNANLSQANLTAGDNSGLEAEGDELIFDLLDVGVAGELGSFLWAVCPQVKSGAYKVTVFTLFDIDY
jgi:hypothetical protein